MIYLDNAATTLIKPVTVERAVVRAMRTLASPGRGSHNAAMRAAETVYNCRIAAASLFNAPDPENVVFTMNATHALNIAINSLAAARTRVVVSGFEHNSVTRPLYNIGAEIVTAGTKLFDPVNTLEAFDAALKNAELAVCTHVSNAFGYIIPIYDIAELCRKYSVPLIVDASQSAGIIDLDFQKLSAAFVAMPGHKGLFGPQGTGILICGDVAKPLMCGGSGSDSVPQSMPEYLPDRLEAGTHNVCGIAGLLEGIKYVQGRGTGEIYKHDHELMALMRDTLADDKAIEIFAGAGMTQAGVLSLRSGIMDCESISDRLNAQGICVRSGLHCAPFAHRSIGTLDTGTVRFSFSPFISEEEITIACRTLQEILHEAA